MNDEYVNIKLPYLTILEHDRENGMIRAQRYYGDLVEVETYPDPIPPEGTKVRYIYWGDNENKLTKKRKIAYE